MTAPPSTLVEGWEASPVEQLTSRLAGMGAELVTTEMVLFEWLRSAESDAFREIEEELQSLIKPLRQAKIETIKYYRENPNSYSVVTGTDLIKDFIKDIKTLLEK